MIELKEAKRHYVNCDVVTKALDGVDLTIEAGEFLAIMGPSGSGKSTLMHVLGFLDTLSDGSYVFREREVSELNDRQLADMRQEEIGFVFQAFNLLKKSSVIENVMLPTLYGDVPREKRRARATQAIKAVAMDHRTNHLSNQLSGGEKQRVAIARALVNEPSVIFADEPTGNLDTKTGAQILDLLSDLHKDGHTIVMVTHEEEAAEYASRIIRLRDGKLESDTRNGKQRRGGYSK